MATVRARRTHGTRSVCRKEQPLFPSGRVRWHAAEPWPCERGPWHAGACVATVHGVTIEWPCPTVLTFHGETGEDWIGARFDPVWKPWLDRSTICPAPTPEAP